MVICKLSRPCFSPEHSELVLYCSPEMVSSVLSDLPDSDKLSTSIEFICVVTK